MPPPYCYPYPRPSVTVDLVVFAFDPQVGRVSTLLIRRKHDPFAGQWALPGGFLDLEETAEDGARRELREETGLASEGPVAPLGAFSAPGRDPRGRTISLAFAALLGGPIPEVGGSDDAAEAAWQDLAQVQGLAFDHDEILDAARDWLRLACLGPDALRLLPSDNAVGTVGALHRAVYGHARGAAGWLRRMGMQAASRTTSEAE